MGSQPLVKLADGRQLVFDRIALCFGNMPPAEAPGLGAEARSSGRYIHDPWRAGDLRAIPSDAEVLVVGSGLTMADVVQTLSGQGHTGPITVVSRHGLIPLLHEPPRAHRMSQPKVGLLAMVRTVCAEAKAARAIGKDWRDVVDALRPWISNLWRGLSAADRRKFLRHLRPYWEVHRHRLAPATADALANLQGAGLLTVAAGRIGSIDWRRGGFEVVMRPRGASRTVRLTPSWIVNCTGPQSDYAKVENPLVKNALDAGAIRPDPLRQGLDVTGEGAVIDARGQRSSTIFAVGSPTRGVFWEITSVPDILRECHRMASVLLRDQ